MENGLLNQAVLCTWFFETQDEDSIFWKRMKTFFKNFHSWINYIQRVGINRPWSRAKNGLHNRKSCKKQVRFQKYWLQKLNYLNQKPNAHDQISGWQDLIWSTGNHLLFYKLKFSNKFRQPCADLKFKCRLHYLALILMQFRILIFKEHWIICIG